MFNDYLVNLPKDDRAAFERVIMLVQENVPEAVEGLSYGLPAFKYNDRPLLGFSSNTHGLNIYPFDPRIIDHVRPLLDGYEVEKGVVRFTSASPVPDHVILAMLEMRIEYLKNAR